MVKERHIKFYEAVNEALDLCLAKDPSVYVMGLGVPDPKGGFGTTLGLQEKYGPSRVMDMPASENAMTGVAIGSALVGMRPVLSHQRLDFALLSMDQLVNQAANWHYMFAGEMCVPIVIRMTIGRGWGQGPQHSQSLQAWFSHIPGLKVVMPTTASDAKGLLIASIEDNNPVIFLEHRWLYNLAGPVAEGIYRVPLGQPRIIRAGDHVTIAAISYMTVEALRAAELLAKDGVSAEVVDLRTLKPLNGAPILESVRKTGHLVVADPAWKTCGFGGELVALVVEQAFYDLKASPRRVTAPDLPTPTSAALADHYYPRAVHIVAAVRETLGMSADSALLQAVPSTPLDVPEPSYTGPF